MKNREYVVPASEQVKIENLGNVNRISLTLAKGKNVSVPISNDDEVDQWADQVNLWDE